MIRILVGDSVQRLKELDSNSVDSVVCDPPYGLGTPPPIEDVLRAWLAGEVYHAKGTGFMANEWDSFVPGPEIWKEAFRVLKPGGHLLSFFGTRTYDVGCMAIRLAGFEPRDCISWLYGCLSDDTEILVDGEWRPYVEATKGRLTACYDIESDAITWLPIEELFVYRIKDTAFRIHSSDTDQIVSGDHRCIVEGHGIRSFIRARDLASEHEVNVPVLDELARHFQGTRSTLARIEPIIYDGIVWCVKVPTGAFVARRNGKIFVTGNSGFPKSLNIAKAIDKSLGVEPTVVSSPPLLGKAKYLQNGWNGDSRERETLEHENTKGTSPEAAQWDGWGTALKPGQELIVMARKPFDGPLFENVMRWGTGAINIDACRVGHDGGTRKGTVPTGKGHGIYGAGLHGNCEIESTGKGRWPANVCHDGSDEIVGDFPITKSGKLEPHHYMKPSENRSMSGPNQGRHPRQSSYGDEGSAARFFYCAKASKVDRDRGLENRAMASASERAGGRKEDSAGINNPRAGTRTEGRNSHPCVKSTALMQWLCRLVTPPGGTVLDPYMGSGSTGVAAHLEGFHFIGCELSEEYADIAEARIRSVADDVRSEVEGLKNDRRESKKKSASIFSMLGELAKKRPVNAETTSPVDAQKAL